MANTKLDCYEIWDALYATPVGVTPWNRVVLKKRRVIKTGHN
jgi:hypothetical protein